MSKSPEYARRVHGVLLCLLAFGMPNLNLLMSIATILLMAWWFVYPGAKRGWARLRTNPAAIAMAMLFLVHVIWLVNTHDWQYAIKDLRVKLPLLVLAIAVGGVAHSTKEILHTMFWLSIGLWVVMLNTGYQVAVHQGPVLDVRAMVGEISHIRLSLMMVVAIVAAIYFWPKLGKGWKLYSLATCLALVVFLNYIRAATGSVVLFLVLAFSVVFFASRRFGRRGTVAALGLVALPLLAIALWSVSYYQNYFTSTETVPSEQQQTAEGNAYNFYPSFQVENGKHVYYYVSEKEVETAWNARSDLKISYGDSTDTYLIARIYRYLTAKGLHKDKAGIMALSTTDIKRIEQGFAAPAYAEKSGLALRMHTVLYSLHTYANSGDASGLSFFQRLVYWRVAANLIRENFWTGTGTGDVKQTFKAAYDRYGIDLEPQFRLRAHNQFLTFFVSFGVWGFLLFIAMFFIFAYSSRGDYLGWCIVLILAASCLTEDTLETQAGVTFFAFFFALFARTQNRFSSLGPEGHSVDTLP